MAQNLGPFWRRRGNGTALLIAFVQLDFLCHNGAVDRLTSQRRSWLMSRVKGRDTTSELVVRRMLYALGYRYRLHCKDLPGKPDLVFRPRKKVVFVHGCFWHGHRCPKGRLPKSNVEFWREKIRRNKARDRKRVRELIALGWEALTIWQCELKDPLAVRRRIVDFLA